MKADFKNGKTRSLFSEKKKKILATEARSLLSCVSVSLKASQSPKDVINTPFLCMRMESGKWRVGALDRHGVCLVVSFVENETETFALLEVKEYDEN